MNARFEFQKAQVSKIVRLLNGGQRVLFWLDTGGGKTHVAVEVIRRYVKRGQRVLFMAHGRELIFQARDRLVSEGIPEESIGVIMGKDSYGTDREVIVASVQTLRRRDDYPGAHLLVIDEAHHTMAESWQAIADAYSEAGAHVLGLTATPYRLDGRGLGGCFDTIVRGPSMLELFAMGTLARPKFFSVDPGDERATMIGVKVVRGDFEPGAAERVMSGKALIGSFVSEYERVGKGLPGVVYACSVVHAKAIGKRFRSAGYRVAHVDADTPKDDRDSIMSDLASGRVQIVTNVNVLSEGWDCPPAKVCLMARPTKSRALWKQIVGRFLRQHKRQTPVVLDFAGNVWRFGLPWDVEEATLEAGVKAKGEPPIRYCSECGAVNELAATECEECGSELGMTTRERREKDEEAGRLAEVMASEEKRKAERERIAQVAATIPALKNAAKRKAWLGQVYQQMGL